METNLEHMSKRKQELKKTGFNFVVHTREESEANRPDYTRFFAPERYMTEEELRHFKALSKEFDILDDQNIHQKLSKEIYF